MARIKASEEEVNKANEYKKALEEQETFKSRMWNSDKKNQEYSNKLAKLTLREEAKALVEYNDKIDSQVKFEMESRKELWATNEARYKAEGKLSDDEILNLKQEFDLTTEMSIIELKRLGKIEFENKQQSYKLNILKQQNTELEQQRQSALAI